MSVERIRQSLPQLRAPDGRVDAKKLDAMMLEARDGGGLDALERKELAAAVDSFDDAGKQRLLRHLSVLGQSSAFVNVETRDRLREVDGRYGTLATDVKGLTVRVGLFDNTFAVSGRAASAGVLRLTVEGKAIAVNVKAGDRPEKILSAIRKQLPRSVTGVVLGGDARLHDITSFSGPKATKGDAAAHLALYKPQALGLERGEKPLRVVVTGYGAFMGITDNPSAALAQQLAEAGMRGAIVEYRRLDVTHAGVDAFLEEMKKNPPDVILSMGVSSHSQVEELPENVVGDADDGEGRRIVAGEVRPGAPKTLKTDLPVEHIDAALRRFGNQRVVGTSQSDPAYAPDRSAYLCNYLGFNLANTFGPSESTTAGFVHVTETTPVEQLQAVLEAVVARQLEWRRQRRAA
ncbi:MAG: hypothetical protein JNK82_29605 [Myxococcaceae bacterium]|nr:hypothetical protein [Myxococcaceae bacterium]